MVKFKGKEYALKELFIREEAALAKQYQRIASEDLEIKADAMVEAIHIMTGIDKGDLNGSKLAEISAVMREITIEKNAKDSPQDEAPATGKV